MNKIFTIGAAIAAVVAAVPAAATSFTFSTTNGGTTSSAYAYGNVRTYQATSTDGQKLDVKATAWSINAANTVSSAYLASYDGGLGVINRTEGDGSVGNIHTIDNLANDDFVLLQFSQSVTLTSAILNAFSVYGDTPDNDATIAWGKLTGAWNQALSLNGITETALDKMFTGTVDIAGNGTAARTFSITGSGNMWLIGASQSNPDCITDGFKLAGLTVSSVAAVPEPATWAMMLVGFGMVGASARYRRRSTATKVVHA